MLRRCNHASAKYSRRVLLQVLARYYYCRIPRFFRSAAAVAEPALYGKLKQSAYRYAIRLKSNPVLERRVARQLVRLLRRPSRRPKEFYAGSPHQAKSWDAKRRVVAKVEWHTNELFPCAGFIVMNPPCQARKVVKSYNGRGTAEQWIKGGKNAGSWTRLFCQTFESTTPGCNSSPRSSNRSADSGSDPHCANPVRNVLSALFGKVRTGVCEVVTLRRWQKAAESHAQHGLHAQPNHTLHPSVDRVAVGRNTYGMITRPDAFRGLVIWDIPAYIL